MSRGVLAPGAGATARGGGHEVAVSCLELHLAVRQVATDGRVEIDRERPALLYRNLVPPLAAVFRAVQSVPRPTPEGELLCDRSLGPTLTGVEGSEREQAGLAADEKSGRERREGLPGT